MSSDLTRPGAAAGDASLASLPRHVQAAVRRLEADHERIEDVDVLLRLMLTIEAAEAEALHALIGLPGDQFLAAGAATRQRYARATAAAALGRRAVKRLKQRPFTRTALCLSRAAEDDGYAYVQPYEPVGKVYPLQHAVWFQSAPEAAACLTVELVLDEQVDGADVVATASLRLSAQECEQLRDWLGERLAERAAAERARTRGSRGGL